MKMKLNKENRSRIEEALFWYVTVLRDDPHNVADYPDEIAKVEKLRERFVKSL